MSNQHNTAVLEKTYICVTFSGAAIVNFLDFRSELVRMLHEDHMPL